MSSNGSSLQRSTKEQIVCYLDFVKRYPELKLTTKLEHADVKRNEILWTELTAKLNALKGPKRTREKWRQSLTHWRNQIRSRARKEKAAKDGSVCQKRRVPRTDDQSYETELRNIENDIIKIENAESEDEDEKQIAVVSEPISDTETLLPPPPAAEEAHTSRPAMKRQEMFETLIGIMRDKEEREKRFHEETMNCFKATADSMSNLANAVTALAEAIINRKI